MSKVKITNYDYSSKWHKKIMVFSDIHYYSKNDETVLDKLLILAQIKNPDYLCIPGDLIDVNPILDKGILLSFLRSLAKICPVLISIGNHDMRIQGSRKYWDNELWDSIEKAGCFILDNCSFEDDDLKIMGITIPYEYYYEKRENDPTIGDYIEKHLEENTDIVLIHTPNVLNSFKNKQQSLLICGHMHAGLLPSVFHNLFKNRGLVSPRKGLFPKYCYGHIVSKHAIISGGITKVSYSNPFHLFKNCFVGEIVEINI